MKSTCHATAHWTNGKDEKALNFFVALVYFNPFFSLEEEDLLSAKPW